MKKSYYPEYDFSSYGNALSRGYRNNNPVNIRIGKSAWQGKITPSGDTLFEQFNDMVHGYRAALVLLRNYIKSYGLNTIEKLITRFAPDNENDTAGYIANVSRMTGIPKDQVISRNDRDSLTRIVWAMSQIENKNTTTTPEGRKALELGLPDMNIINQAWSIM